MKVSIPAPCHRVSLFLIIVFVQWASGSEVTFEGKKLTPLVDLSENELVGAQGTYAHIKQAQLRDSKAIFTACEKDDADQVGLFSADINGVSTLLELGVAPLANATSIDLADFRDFGPETPIPLVIEEGNNQISLSFFEDAALSSVVDSSTIVPGTESDHFTSIESVVAVGHEVAFVGTSDQNFKGIYLFTEGILHELDSNDSDPFSSNRFGNELTFDGEKVHYFRREVHARFPGDIYEVSLSSPPSLVISGEGVIDDQGVSRKYRIERDIISLDDELVFMVDLEIRQSTFGTAVMGHDGTDLRVIARSSNYKPVDEFTLRVNFQWQPFSDNVNFYLSGPNHLYRGFEGFATSSLLRRSQGFQQVVARDLEKGLPLVIENGDLPERLWTDPLVPGPVEFPTPMTSQAVALGGTAVFEIEPEGLEPFTYQWSLNDGEVLDNETSNRLVLENIGWEDVGMVSVWVSNGIDSKKATASLDIEAPPEMLLTPSDRKIVLGEDVDIFLRARGKRPLRYEFTSKPAGSSLELFIVGSVFDDDTPLPFWRVTLDQFSEADVGTYSIKVSNDLGSIEFDLELGAAEIPPNSSFREKPFTRFWDSSEPAVNTIASSDFDEKRWIWDGDNQRFLNPNADDSGIEETLVAFDPDGNVSPIFGSQFEELDLDEPHLIGHLDLYGNIFYASDDLEDVPSIYGEKDGIVSVLVSSQQLQNEFILDPDDSDLDLKAYRGSIVGLVRSDGFDNERDWAILQYENGVAKLLVTSNQEQGIDIREDYLGCDEQFRPLFFDGNDFTPGGPPFIELSPKVKRIEADGSRTILRVNDLPPELADYREDLVRIPSDGGTKYLGWGAYLVEVLEDRLEVHQVSPDNQEQTVFGMDFAEHSFATEYRVFFLARSYPEALSSSDIEILDLEIGFDSLSEKIFSWTLQGVDEVFSGSFFDGNRFPPKTRGRTEGRILGAVGDQVLVEHSLGDDFIKSEILINKGIEEVLPKPVWGKGRDGLYLDTPIGTQLEQSTSLENDWKSVPTSGGSMLITSPERKLFFRVK